MAFAWFFPHTYPPSREGRGKEKGKERKIRKKTTQPSRKSNGYLDTVPRRRRALILSKTERFRYLAFFQRNMFRVFSQEKRIQVLARRGEIFLSGKNARVPQFVSTHSTRFPPRQDQELHLRLVQDIRILRCTIDNKNQRF